MSENKSYAASMRWPDADQPVASDPVRSPEDQVALAYRQCEPWLHRWLASTFVSDAEAEEIVQEAFLRLHAVLVEGERIEHPQRWVSAVARNLALNQVRRRERERRKWDVLTQALLHLRRGPQTPEETLVEQSRAARVEAALRALPTFERECVLARREGLKLREIASLVGKDLRRVAEAIERGVKRVRKQIDE